MSKYRIKTNGEHFIVQKKIMGLFWRCPDEWGCMGNSGYALLDTLKEAKEYLKKQEQRDINRARKWKII